MKTLRTALMMSLMVVSLIGCAKQKAYVSPPVPERGSDIAPPEDIEQPLSGTNTVALSNVSTSTLRSFFFKNPPNNPTNVRVVVELSPNSEGIGGEIRVQFDDNGVTRQAVLTSNHPYSNISDSSLNQWFTYNNNQVFHGIYQDSAGAVVLVVDSVLSQGDGGGSSILGGSIWFQNFGYTNAAQGPNKMCWEIQIGPYDCRTFLQGGVDQKYDKAVVNTYSSLEPTTRTLGGDATNTYNGSFGGDRPKYIKLGTFSGLLRSSAFQQ